MTERLYVGSTQDLNLVREALDFAMDMPQPGSVNGVPIVDEQTKVALKLLWWSMSQMERDAQCFNPTAPWVGWTLQWTDVVNEVLPGTRKGCWIPGDTAAVISTAALAGRVLSLAQAAALNTAALVSLPEFPADWETGEG